MRLRIVRTVFTASFALIGVLVLLVAIIGLMLPQEHVAARSVRVRQTPERVFEIISDFEKMPTWRPDITRVEMLPPPGAGGGMIFREHGSDVVTYVVVASQPPSRLVTRIADADLPYSGTWTYDVAPIASTPAASTTGASTPLTQITITERGEVYNPIFRFMSRFVFSHHATIDAYLTALGKKLGESVTPEAVSAP
jgi:uncharacterized protein YndB with AHSA1/START domain